MKEEGQTMAGHIDKELRRLDRKKVYYLNNVIFPSMANIVYFLEAISKNPELQEEFDDDLKDLFGLRYPEDLKNRGYNPVIRRLTDAIIDWTERPIDDEEKLSSLRNSNLRLALMAIMQQVIYYKARTLSVQEMSEDISNTIINDDFGRAWVWAQLFAKSVRWETGHPHRPTKF